MMQDDVDAQTLNQAHQAYQSGDSLGEAFLGMAYLCGVGMQQDPNWQKIL
ncbi:MULTISPECIES: hypothetical protein [unclassified Helicobacter]|nr:MULTISPECIES: hypothetical protein [unclassified Helicobacter]